MGVHWVAVCGFCFNHQLSTEPSIEAKAYIHKYSLSDNGKDETFHSL